MKLTGSIAVRPISSPTRNVSLLIAVLLLLPSLVRADESDQILFLHLILKDGAVTLVDSVVKPGRLKSPHEPDKQGELHLELITTNGASLWSGVLVDPLTRRYEYEDPASVGALKRKTVQLAESEFTVRVPFHKEAAQLRVLRVARPVSRKEALAVPEAEKKWTSIVVLPTTGAVP